MAIGRHVRVVFETPRRNATGVGVTVIITLYNYERYIRDALHSVLSQSYSNIELIIVDDASSDDSRNSARSWLEQNGASFTHVKLLSHLNNRGLAQARNTGFEHTTNEHVFVLDADNEIYPDAIAKLMSACISANAEVAYSFIEKFGDITGVQGDVWNPSRFATGNYVDAMALIKRSAWKKAGGYSQPSEIQGWEDYDLWCKFVELGFRGIFVPEILCRYRVHDSSMLTTTTMPNLGQLEFDMTKRHPWLRLGVSRTFPEKVGSRIWRFRILAASFNKRFGFMPRRLRSRDGFARASVTPAMVRAEISPRND